ncbi:hypothetical protein CBP51_15125 [Cellvibrio mixtus]|uniref:Uncharacterized protein n=1 Tax=Cellvibrio mixtus TaxID=39650 RepID=A0A266Q3U9_9GAMM|nr:hypothetical protein [Cellvibrio mixtus]OZY84525.1 hypothetical protein CBP51_15125 [Cellvibrio mixtus]
MKTFSFLGFTITPDIFEYYECSMTPWGPGCVITAPDGQVSQRFAVNKLVASKQEATTLAIKYGIRLVKEYLNERREIF